MTQAEAQGLINSGHKISVEVWGDDPVFDDILRAYPLSSDEGYGHGVIFANSTQGLAFRFHHYISRRTLDEDSGFRPAPRDEVYVRVKLLNSGGGLIRSARTNSHSALFEVYCREA